MDFIARSGSLINQSYRIAGFLFILVTIQAFIIVQLYNGNRDRDAEFERLRDELKVYVVPGSQAGIYGPSRNEMLMESFAAHVAQSLHTYTYNNWERQYQEVRNFFTPNFLTFSQKRFERLIRNARSEGRSALFVPDRSTMKSEDVDVTMGGVKQKRITMEGEQTIILGGQPVETERVKITMLLNQSYVSATNPFGFVLADYKAEVIKPKR